MNKAIFCEVDVQHDFATVVGALTVNPKDEVLGNMIVLQDRAPILVGSVDSHDFEAWEFNTNDNKGPNGEDPQFPPHCVIGTYGWLRYGEHYRQNIQFIPRNAISAPIHEKTDTVMLMKEVYSLFANPFAEQVLDWASQKLGGTDVVVVYGIATDYCVKAAVLGLLERGWKVIVAEDAIAGVNEKDSKVALEYMQKRGAMLMTTKEICEHFGKKE